MKKLIAIVTAGVITTLSVMTITVNAEGFLEWVTDAEHVYDYVYGFDHGLAGVRRGGDVFDYTNYYNGVNHYENNYHGVINDKGEEIIPCQEGNIEYGWNSGYEQLGLGNGYAWTIEDGKSTVYNYDGDVVGTYPFTLQSAFNENLFVAEKGTDKLLVNLDFEVVLSIENGSYFSSITFDGEECIEAIGDDYVSVYSNNLNEIITLYDTDYINIYGDLICGESHSTQKKYVINKNQEYIVERDKYDYCIVYAEDGIIKCSNERSNVMDVYSLSGVKLFSGSTYDIYMGYKTYLTKNDGKYSLYNIETQTAIDLSGYTYEEPANDMGLVILSDDSGKFGAMNGLGDIVVPFEYDHIDDWSNRLEAYKDGVCYYAYVVNGKVVIPYTTDYISQEGEYYKSANKLYDKNGELLIELDEEIYIDDVCDTDYGKIIVIGKNGKYGVCDTDGNIIVPLEYSEYIDVVSTYIIVNTSDPYREGMYDLSGELVIPVEYDYIYKERNLLGQYIDNSKFCFVKDGKRGIIDVNTGEKTPCIYKGIICPNDDLMFACGDDYNYKRVEFANEIPVKINTEQNGNDIKVNVETTHVNPVNVISAFYKDGIMVKTETNCIKDGLASFDVDIQNNDADSYKIFVWDMDNMFPCTDAISGLIQ